MNRVAIVVGVIILAAVIFIGLTMYVSSTEDPCSDSKTYGEYQACQFIDRAEERCKGLKGTDIYIECLIGRD